MTECGCGSSVSEQHETATSTPYDKDMNKANTNYREDSVFIHADQCILDVPAEAGMYTAHVCRIKNGVCVYVPEDCAPIL